MGVRVVALRVVAGATVRAGAAGDGRRNDDAIGFDVVVLTNFLDHVRNRVQLHYLAVNDRLVRKVLKAKTGKTPDDFRKLALPLIPV